MTYEEKLFSELEHIAERHKKAFEENCSEKVKELVYGKNKGNKEIYIKFNRHSIPESSMEYEYYYFNAPIIVNEMRFDINSLVEDTLHLCEPEYGEGFTNDKKDVGGFLVRVPENWSKEYKDKEFKEPENTPGIYHHVWNCTDEQLASRYKYFNNVISACIKKRK